MNENSYYIYNSYLKYILHIVIYVLNLLDIQVTMEIINIVETIYFLIELSIPSIGLLKSNSLQLSDCNISLKSIDIPEA